MRAILPGRPNAELAAVTTGLWEGRQLIAYISGNALVILGGPRHIIQTTYNEDEDDLVSVVLDEPSGKIAVASKKAAYVYKPYGLDIGQPKWSLQHTLTLPDAADEIRTLSWGLAEELLVGSASLTLFSTHNHESERLFSTPLASPAKFAHFSYDATFIASTSQYDRLVKVWHRLSFGSVEERFDVAYLPHPTTVTGLHWRRPRHREQSIENVLYTICADNKVRVWVGGEHFGPEIFQLWADIDLAESIKPRALDPSSRSGRRYTFFIDSADFAVATEKAVQQASDKRGQEESHALQHLIEVANRTPEVCVVLDDKGNMSAWGLESVDTKTKKTSAIFNIAHVEGLKLHFAKDVLPIEDNVQFYSFCGDTHGSSFTLLMHHFDGRLEWLEGKIDFLFDPSPLKLTRLQRETILTGHTGPIKKAEICKFDLGDGEGLAYVIPVDPAGTPSVISGFLDTFARDVAISYTTSGVIKSWTARLSSNRKKLEWLCTSTVDTGVDNPTLCSGTSIRKAALVDAEKTGLTIWSTRSAQLEHEERFESHDIIQDIDWSSSPDNQSILAVGFPHRVVIYAQLRYNYLDHGPSWAAIREIRIREFTPHPIGDSVWLGRGNLVIGAGNQLFVQDEHVEVDDGVLPDFRLATQSHREAHRKKEVDLFTLVSRLNGPLPVYHPQLLAQCVLLGKLPLVQRILINLYRTLKFYTEGDSFDTFLGLSPEEFFLDQDNVMNGAARKEMQSSYADFTDADDEPASVTEEVAANLNELLLTKSVPQLSNREQFHLADIVECVGTVEKHRRSVDDNACRFLLFFRQHYLRDRDGQRSEDKAHISWREITWAYHSGSQDILMDLVSRHFQGRMLWKQAKEAGIFMWMTDLNALRAQFEVIARNEYTKTEEKNPVDCSLYYLALRKKAVLIGLWRMATWNREQSGTHRLLQNNFNEARWRTAALKNAYALMGRHRFEYAAAFFLLADHLQDAVSILANQMNDMQLAIAVARVYEGDDGPVLRKFITERVLPHAVMEGNRWMATWAFWMLGKRDVAVRALVTPLSGLLSPPDSPSLQSKLFLTDDPALVVLYRQLRDKSLQTLRGALAVTPRAEWEFLVHTARLYERMGCDLLALDLVRSWEFLAPQQPREQLGPLPTRLPPHSSHHGPLSPGAGAGATYDIDPRKLLRRRSSLVVADLPAREEVRSALDGFVDEVGGEANGEVNGEANGNGVANGAAEQKKKAPPTQFHEPDANSLLDSFGF
ncbi:wd repeat protein [Neofusicoccum parvum]|nr:wd repeat protein [Neofusicoccum parvum]